MKINKLQIIGLLLLVSLLTVPVHAGTATITIFGTNASNAQANLTNTGNQSVNVTTWNVNGIKTFRVNVTNASDTLTILVANNTANQINELLVNGTSINGAQVNATGWFNYTHTQGTGNVTFTIRPAINQGGFNTIWAWIQYLTVVNQTTINNVIITNLSVLNASNIQGDGHGISALNASNLTIGTVPTSALPAGVTYSVVNVTSNYTIGASNVSGSVYTVYANAGTLNVTLPTPSVVANGTFYNIKKKDASANSVNINVTSAGTIDGGLWANLTTQYSSITLVRYDQEWNII